MTMFREKVTSRPDPFKRVNYTLGMVLGVDEFEQEQAYFLEADRRHHRLLHGYGTVCGLKVSNEGVEIQVSPGLALSPTGSEIRIPRAQCARLDEWLDVDRNRTALGETSTSGTYSVYVTLCYLECETDAVPIPGTPCRTEEDSMAPSRIMSSFDLKFSATPPDEVEEKAIQALGRLFRRLEISSDPAEEVIGPHEMADEVRTLTEAVDEGPLFVRPDAVEAVLDTALKVWLTEVRPTLLADDKNCACGPPDEECIVLARVDFDADEHWRIDDATVRVVDDERPYVVPTRVLTELLKHRSDGVIDHGRLEGLEDDDHPHYLKVDPATRSLIDDLDASGHRVVNIPTADADGQAVPFQQAIKTGQSAGGDLGETYPNPSVRQFGGEPFTPNPSKGSGWVMTWNGREWTAGPAPRPAGGVDLYEVARALPTSPFVTIRRVPRGGDYDEVWLSRDDPTFELWFHLDVGLPPKANLPSLLEDYFHLYVFGETDHSYGEPFLEDIGVTGFQAVPGKRNVFLITLDPRVDEFSHLRFVFHLEEMHMETGEGDLLTVFHWLENRQMKWIGHDGDQTVTSFYQNDVRHQVVAAGVIDRDPDRVFGDNLQVIGVDSGQGHYMIRWRGYDLEKRERTLVIGHVHEAPGMGEGWPLYLNVVQWEKEGVVVGVQYLQDPYPTDLVTISLQVMEIL